MGIRKTLDSEVYCPLSAFRVGSKIIQPHKMTLVQCANGSLFGYCGLHVARVFIGGAEIISMILTHSKVLSVTERPDQNTLRAMKQRRAHGKKKKG